MRNSLIFKLMGAFLLVIAIGALVISLLSSRAMQDEFQLYTTRSGQMWAQRLVPSLADYYKNNGGWQGVEVILPSDQNPISLTTGGPRGMGYGSGQGRGYGPGGGAGLWSATGQHLVLADSEGIVVSDSSGELVGKRLSSSELEAGAPVTVDGRLAGTLMITPNDFAGLNSPANQFLASVNNSIITAVVTAGVIALILGAFLFFEITAPLRQLKKAAHAITQGDLNQRVSIKSSDEFGELGQTFNQMAESLEKAEIQRKHLVADIAHELRTPLAVIQANLEGMLDDVFPLDKEQITALHTEIQLLNRLVGDLRLLSLAEAGHLKLERAEVSLGDLIRRIAERSKPQAQQKKINLQVDIQDDSPVINIDSDRITQVVNNLIGNALRYTPPKGTITIAVKSGPGSAHVSVTDSGPGIDPEDIPYVFDRFYRGDKSRTRMSGGTGLGLAIVKQLVEAHGGKVEAESPVFQDKNGKAHGTRISFTLPFLSLQ